ncbi:hypothetical protein CFIMG_007009RA [Ceratocystis fimbriata CBS 114723]|uniref:CID domain-containing protein n=1 Tax=Ceratocystis fimbriata CBS 114723 TaxID=1035309 RepID=A0A2C5WTZ0_9PEZI|nr:hypothetical protein CFIMG_007009RA [Ceratocystis fimbriata CBS 114723]
MTSHQLAITKASLSSALFRKDPVACDRNDIDAFHNLLHEAVQRCSPPNVQACKNWIAEHIVPSATRIAALGRFFCAYIDTLVDPTAEAPKKPKARRKRLHVLYIVNDILHHTLAQSPDNIFLQSFESSLKPLFASAAAVEKSTNHISKLNELIRIWEERQYVAAKTIDTLRDTMTGALADTSAHNAAMDIAPDPVKGPTLTKEVPYMLPSIHGDPAVPWYDLPASTWLPHMTPNSTKPMTPSMIKPLHMNAGPPDKALVDAVKGLLSNVDQIYAKDCSLDLQEHTDINELGEVVSLDEITGSVLGGETYYGWSRDFCIKMKALRTSKSNRGRSSNRSDSRGRSRSIARRYSYTPSRSHSRGRSRSYSRSNSPPAFKRRRISRPRSRSLSRSRSHSRSHGRDGSQRRSHSRGRYDQRSYTNRPTSRSRSNSNLQPHHSHHNRQDRSQHYDSAVPQPQPFAQPSNPEPCPPSMPVPIPMPIDLPAGFHVPPQFPIHPIPQSPQGMPWLPPPPPPPPGQGWTPPALRGGAGEPKSVSKSASQ